MIKQVYHPYTEWEDYKMGMYEKTCFMDDHSMIKACEVTLKCRDLLWSCMHLYRDWETLSSYLRSQKRWSLV